MPLSVDVTNLMRGDKGLPAALFGGGSRWIERPDLCAEYGVSVEIENVAIDDVNEAWQRLKNNDVRYRFIADFESLS